MKTTFITTNNVDALKNALGQMVDYAHFLAGEDGWQDRVGFIDHILNECGIEYTEEEN